MRKKVVKDKIKSSKNSITYKEIIKEIGLRIKQYKKMSEKIEKIDIKDFKDVKPIELERVLKLYGMQKKYYCELCNRSKSWWYVVLLKRKYLSYSDIKILTDDIGLETFEVLLRKVREQHPVKNEKN
ncbi:MAG: hypothetical protein FWG85_08195 [Bacteroidetes bacterium]|nr:hypothetical protein [Bacteroidota bacterium]